MLSSLSALVKPASFTLVVVVNDPITDVDMVGSTHGLTQPMGWVNAQGSGWVRFLCRKITQEATISVCNISFS